MNRPLRKCFACRIEIGGNTGRKLLTCARCRSTAYCSKECQKRDWANHGPHCATIAKIHEKAAEVHGGDRPGRQLVTDLPMLPDHFQKRVVVAARTALQLTRPTSLSRTHLIEVVFVYKPDEAEWANRFAFESIEVVPFKDGERVGGWDVDGKSADFWKERLAAAQADLSKMDPEKAFYTAWTVRYDLEGRPRRDQTLIPFFPADSTPWWTTVDDMWFACPLNPDWKGFFRRYASMLHAGFGRMIMDDIAESRATEEVRRRDGGGA